MLVNRVHKPYLCRICGNATGIKVCKCQKAYYCSKNCQKIDWKTHKSDCYKLVDHPQKSSTQLSNNSANENASQSVHLHQQPYDILETSSAETPLARERRQYDPTPFQYQQQSVPTNTVSPPSTIDDFEENLFNSLLYSVDESTEREILKNINIRDEELLKTFNLDNDNSSSLDEQTLQAYQAFNPSHEPSFDEKIFDQIQRQQSFEYKPETQLLLKETRDSLEKELSLFREVNLHEPQQQLGEEELSSSSDGMLSAKNPKYINHAKLDDHMLYK
jgi:hypothetical protein